jgi:NAD-dependent dihydropyrimidine dehydrogenase PreA subunit
MGRPPGRPFGVPGLRAPVTGERTVACRPDRPLRSLRPFGARVAANSVAKEDRLCRFVVTYRSEDHVTYVIAEPCVDVMDKACVDVCPVDCIHFDEGVDRILYIDPDECIDCGACEPECRPRPGRGAETRLTPRPVRSAAAPACPPTRRARLITCCRQ